MPGWQQFYEQNHNGSFELISVAIDAQGPERPQYYVDESSTRFPTLLDKSNMLGRLLGFRVVPNGFLIDENGVLRYREIGKFNIASSGTKRFLTEWVGGSNPVLGTTPTDSGFPKLSSEVNDVFRRGLELYELGMSEQAITLWKKALELDPANYIIRKQIWAVENPEKFYSGDIDVDWQKDKI